jgi:uncharacterized delta-60 repeat protein
MGIRTALLAGLLAAAASARAGDGNFDLSFGTLGQVDTNIGVPNISAVEIQPDQRILASGRTLFTNPLVARFLASGAFDSSFGNGGIASMPAVTGQPYSLAVQPDGAILFAGTAFSSALLGRFDANGNPDLGFGAGGSVNESAGGATAFVDMALDPAGKVVAVGGGPGGVGSQIVVGRYLLSDGSPDPTFWNGGTRAILLPPSAGAGSIVRQPDGKLVIGGSISTGGQVVTLTAFVMRLDDAGSVDGAFATNGVIVMDLSPRSDIVGDVALQPDGKIVFAGESSGNFLVGRLTTSGALDPTFAGGIGYRTVDLGQIDSGRKVIIQPDGKIVVVGYLFAVVGGPGTGHWVALRFLADGTLDPSFGDNGRVVVRPTPGPGISYSAARQSDGKLVIATLNGSAAVGPLSLVRLGGDCGDGSVAGLEQCDDANAVAGDCCDLACQPEPALQPCPNSTSVCLAHRCDGAGKCGVPEIPTNCTPSVQTGKSTIALKRTAGGSNDTLTWKLRKGGVTPLEALGDPYVSTAYALCGYGPGPSLLFELAAPPGDLCAGRACWSLLGRTGFTYRDRERTPTGLDLLRVRSGDAGRVSMIAKGKGSSLTLPPLPLALPATVQLRTSDGPCWETTFSASGAVRNDDAQFKGRAD